MGIQAEWIYLESHGIETAVFYDIVPLNVHDATHLPIVMSNNRT